MKSKNEAPQPSKTYNGWSNYQTWAVALWLDNEQSCHVYWREQANEHVQSASEYEQVKNGIWTQERAAVFNLADGLKDRVREESPLAEQSSLYSDLLTSALDSVDWQEIATSLIGDINESTIIHAYTRKDAINDGVLIDVTTTANEAGIKHPTAITQAVWSKYVTVPENVEAQDESGRLWDILWVLRAALRESGGSALEYTLLVRNDNQEPKPVKLKAVCDPGDDASPVITIMLPNED